MKSLINLSLLFLTTLTLIACGGGSSGGGNSAVTPPATPPTITKLTIANAQANEGSMLNFKVTANPPIAMPISFSYRIDFENQTALAADLSSDISGRSTIAASSDSTTISILIKDDDIKEPAETFRITLSNLAPAGATFTNNKAVGTIFASDPIKIRISGAAGNEGGMINFKVIATPPIAKQITFKYEATVDNKATNPASISDLSGNLIDNGTIATNDSSTTISILTANDNLRENAETFLVMLSDLSPTSDVTFTDHTAIGTIVANDIATGIITISVADAEASEDASPINFKVSSEFSAATGSPFTFDYTAATNNPFTNKSSSLSDFWGWPMGTATIPVGSDSTTISVLIIPDNTVEPDETFRFLITNPSANATIDSAKNSAIGTILNDDLGEISDATAIIGDEKITLNWTNPNSNIFAGVTIAQTTSTDAPLNCASATNVTIIDPNQPTSDTITGLTNDTAYSFRICAKSNTDSLSDGVPLTNLIAGDIDGDGVRKSIDVDDDNDGLIEITTATELNNIRHNLAGSYITSNGVTSDTGCPAGGCNGYELVADIDLSSFNDGTWDPIGTFTAIFDGNDYTISNLKIIGNNDVGLFSILNNATISNLKLTNIRITGNDNVGALVGQATGTTTLSNIELIGDASQESSNAEIQGTGSQVGGLVGDFNSGTITDASSSLTVRGTGSNIGGLVGLLRRDGSIKYSNSSGFVSASGSSVGGLVGSGLRDAIISQSYASGNVSSIGNSKNRYGGLLGVTSNHMNINQSYATGNVTSTGNSSSGYGGVLGFHANGTISNVWASGVITSNGTNNFNYGGLVGDELHSLGRAIGGRNYQLDASPGTNVGNRSFILGNGNRAAGLEALAKLSGADGNYGTHSNWHAVGDRFCDTNRNGRIDGSADGFLEKTPDNSIWVMPSIPTSDAFPTGMSDNVPAPTTDTAGNPQNYYAIPALRCIGNTKGKTPTEINAIRKANIDRQRRLFPDNR